MMDLGETISAKTLPMTNSSVSVMQALLLVNQVNSVRVSTIYRYISGRVMYLKGECTTCINCAFSQTKHRQVCTHGTAAINRFTQAICLRQ